MSRSRPPLLRFGAAIAAGLLAMAAWAGVVTRRRRRAELSETKARLADEADRRRDAERAIPDLIEREQRRLGQDLHDGLCQTLAGARLMVEELRDHAPRESQD